MNENMILSMAQPYVKDGVITYEQFDGIYNMLSRKEQYVVLEILLRNGIDLVDEDEQIDEETYILDVDDKEDFEILYDEGVFKDSCYFEDEKVPLVIERNVRQSNEILCILIQQGNKQAAQDLCTKNKLLVDKYVAAYQKRYGNRLDFEDLEQVGFIGLIKAAKKFDIHQENAFSTYAVWWIKQAISREIMDNGYAIRIPVHMMEQINKVIRENNKYEGQGLGIENRIKNIAKNLAISEDKIKECLILKKNYLTYASLNSPVSDDEETELGELIPSEVTLSVEDIAEKKELRKLLEEAISTLTLREQRILKLRFGLDDGRARTLEEIGKEFYVTRERIRQIEVKALKKLKHPSRSKRIKDYLD